MTNMKTTVEIEEKLFRSIRKCAIDEGRSFRAVLNDALRAYLGSRSTLAQRTRPVIQRELREDQPTATFKSEVASAEFWATVNDRSSWIDLLRSRPHGTPAVSIPKLDNGTEQ
jgi:hypothetical protein